MEFADYLQPVPEREPYVSLFERPMLADGTKAFERLKTQAVLDGRDLSDFQFVEPKAKEEPEHDRESSKEPKPVQEAAREAAPERPEDLLEEPGEEPDFPEEEEIDFDALMRVGYTLDGRNIDLSTGQEILLEEEMER